MMGERKREGGREREGEGGREGAAQNESSVRRPGVVQVLVACVPVHSYSRLVYHFDVS